MTVQVGPGVKLLREGDWVLPFKTHLGTWRTLVVANDADLLRIDQDLMPFEYLAMWREMCAAYRLLEDQRTLKVATDSVISLTPPKEK